MERKLFENRLRPLLDGWFKAKTEKEKKSFEAKLKKLVGPEKFHELQEARQREGGG